MAKPWYQDGLRFECTRCGKCCSGFPGFVWVSPDEIKRIAEFRGETVEEATGLHTRVIYGRRSLRDNLRDDCVFYDPAVGCLIYPVRPRQCQTWPFWESNLASKEAWDRAEAVCPGAGQGEVIPVEEITRRLKVVKI
jgi:hypothetical protein